MNLTLLLRALVILQIVLVGANIGLEAWLGNSLLPEGLQSFIESDALRERTAVERVAIPTSFAVLAIYIVAWIGLLCLWQPARWVFAAGVAISFGLAIILPYDINSGLDSFLMHLGVFCDAATLILVFGTPLWTQAGNKTAPPLMATVANQ